MSRGAVLDKITVIIFNEPSMASRKIDALVGHFFEIIVGIGKISLPVPVSLTLLTLLDFFVVIVLYLVELMTAMSPGGTSALNFLQLGDTRYLKLFF